MRFLLTSQGSTGDLFPVVGLGYALRQAGHEVMFAAPPYFQAEIERAGLDYLRVPPDWSQGEFAEAMRSLARTRNKLRQLELIYEGAHPHLPEYLRVIEDALPDVDALVGSYLFPHLDVLARRAGKPFAAVAFCHQNIPTADRPPEALPSFPFLPISVRHGWNRLAWKIGEFVVDRAIHRILKDILRERGLPPKRHFFSDPADLVIVAVPTIMERLHDSTPPQFRFTGYLRWQSSGSDTDSNQLDQFLQGERVPVLTFGSVTADDMPAAMQRFVATWPKGRKLIVQAGWADLKADPSRSEILVVGSMSHDLLFSRASVIIHHGGAGTTASSLHSGNPQIIIPHIADQPFWAGEVSRLGCGCSLPRQHWPEELTSTIDRVLCDTQYAENASATAATLRRENGPANAISLLEAYARTGSPPA